MVKELAFSGTTVDKVLELKNKKVKFSLKCFFQSYLSLSRLRDFWLSGVCLPSCPSSCFLSSSSLLSELEVMEAMEAAEGGRVCPVEGPGVELSGVGGCGPERFFTRFGLAAFLLLSRSSSVSPEI